MTAEMATGAASVLDDKKIFYNRFLLIVAGLGGLLYGVDVGIIAGALPYLEATSGLNAGQLSIVVAAVLLGSVISTLFAGLLADWMGRKSLMALSGVMFVISIPMIALSHGYGPLVFGRLLQGVSAGLIGVVVPLYLAECLTASSRGKGTGIFQWLLTAGNRDRGAGWSLLQLPRRSGRQAWRCGKAARLQGHRMARHFLGLAAAGHFLRHRQLHGGGVSALAVASRQEGRRLRRASALADDRAGRSRTARNGGRRCAAEKAKAPATQGQDSLLRRKYVIPFVLACIILACNQATGINSIIAYNTNILLQSGLSDVAAHWGYVVFTIINFAVTFGGVMLVDRKGRKFLLGIGTAGIIVSLICTGVLFLGTEKPARRRERMPSSRMVAPDQTLALLYNEETARKLLSAADAAT